MSLKTLRVTKEVTFDSDLVFMFMFWASLVIFATDNVATLLSPFAKILMLLEGLSVVIVFNRMVFTLLKTRADILITFVSLVI